MLCQDNDYIYVARELFSITIGYFWKEAQASFHSKNY